MSMVQIVFCMDTEGPVVDSRRTDLLDSWERVDAAMDKLFAPAFRTRLLDSSGGGFRIGWFFLTWTGFATNPVGRDLGYHKVRDHYLARWGDAIRALGDEACWHYHHPAASRVGNEWGLDWSLGDEYAQIMSRQILERDWFPSGYRAGGTIMDTASSRWVDAWFPFDYSNRAPLALPGLVDWSGGVAEWAVYHPSPERFDRPGAGRRRMARCLDLDTTVYKIGDADIEQAFARAAAGRPAILSCFDHDYRDIADRVMAFRERVQSVAARYPDVPWSYASPGQAIRQYLGQPAPPPLRLEAMADDSGVTVWGSAPIFQSMPWLAVRNADGAIRHVEADVVRLDDTHWRWTPPADAEWIEAGFGASTDLGESAVVRVFRNDRVPRGFLEQEHLADDPNQPRSIWEYSKLYTELCLQRAAGEGEETDSVRQARELLDGRVDAGATLLDVGCAAGHAWLGLRALGLSYYGIDSHPRGIEIGRALLPTTGLPGDRLRALTIEDLPRDETYDVVLSLNMLSYQPMFHLPLEAMARAARQWLIVRSAFGDATTIRFLPDPWLEPGHESTRAYFNVFSRDEVRVLLESEGFEVAWVADRRQTERFGGAPEVVAGIPLPAEFLVARRVRSVPSTDEVLGPAVAEVRKFRAARAGRHDVR